MEWIEAKITTTHNAIESLTGVLLECGIEGIQIDDDMDLKNFLENNYLDWDYVDEELANKTIEDTIITFYVSKNAYGLEMLNNLKNRLSSLKSQILETDFGKLRLDLLDVDDEDWSENWKKYYKPFRVGKNIIVCPIWEQYTGEDNDIIFTIDPGSAFGTGLHQTTQLCMESLEKKCKKGLEILDLGCGSGILSIVALLLGCKSAIAVDIDKNAVENALNNGKINKVKNYEGLYGDFLKNRELSNKIKEKKYDIIVANIVADVIISICSQVKVFMKNDGIFIASGIIKSRLEDVKAKLDKENFQIIEINEKDEWVCVVCKHKIEE